MRDYLDFARNPGELYALLEMLVYEYFLYMVETVREFEYFVAKLAEILDKEKEMSENASDNERLILDLIRDDARRLLSYIASAGERENEPDDIELIHKLMKLIHDRIHSFNKDIPLKRKNLEFIVQDALIEVSLCHMICPTQLVNMLEPFFGVGTPERIVDTYAKKLRYNDHTSVTKNFIKFANRKLNADIGKMQLVLSLMREFQELPYVGDVLDNADAEEVER